MAAVALARRLARTRRRKPKPPFWWLALAMLTLGLTVLAVDVMDSYLPGILSVMCGVIAWWSCLHNPPTYAPRYPGHALWLGASLCLALGGLALGGAR